MGTAVTLIGNVLRKCLGPAPPGPRRYLDIGSQHLFGGTPEDYRDFLRYCGGGDQPEACRDLSERSTGTRQDQTLCSEAFALTDWEYQSVDLYYATIEADLNTWQPEPTQCGTFDFVVNFGTTEHLFDQLNCFRSIHDSARVGGFMCHFVPTDGFIYHSLFRYDPKVFLLLAEANDYEIVHASIVIQHIKSSKVDTRHETWADYELAARLDMDDALVEFIFRKTADQPFKLPYDISNSDRTIRKDFDPPCSSLR